MNLRNMLRGQLAWSKIPMPELSMECAPIPTPASLPAAVDAAIQRGFPIDGADFFADVPSLTMSEGNLVGTLWYDVYSAKGVHLIGGIRDVTVLTAEELAEDDPASLIGTRFAALQGLSTEAFRELMSNGFTDPLRPPQAELPADLRDVLDDIFPYRADRLEVALIGHLSGEQLGVQLRMTHFDADGGFMQCIEQEVTLLSAAELADPAATATLRKRLANLDGKTFANTEHAMPNELFG